ncbi:hypothetical protein CERSUDRAFT_81516 [Gelatoporia subvermispora B]|uniref:Uncharacterized protein n=1 Tax=Ceriporiopsis subvermispora (strain B) TaxID=914234 RepID=M2PU32_CERS8|nr:hypothetical protein CERSUDRAFT_81516 [Gelatoporia subvermispora B]
MISNVTMLGPNAAPYGGHGENHGLTRRLPKRKARRFVHMTSGNGQFKAARHRDSTAMLRCAHRA